MFTDRSSRRILSWSRRRFVTGIVASGAVLGVGIPGALRNARAAVPELGGQRFDLEIGYQSVNFTGRERLATVVNGSLPAPILRWREGERVTLRVTNHLAHDSSIHWHGLILPADMDGVPGISFSGIKPGETFTYRFDVQQSGTYWYHSHSEFQEQTGLYGAIIIDPRDTDAVAFDREHVIVFSDWSDEKPERIYANLKKQPDYYNFRERTAGDLFRDIQQNGLAQTNEDRAMWNEMRMSDRDLADVTGYTYTYLTNGITPDHSWTALFKRGEKVRLRFVNAAAMTIFDVRIPGLKMTVVAADGQNVEPVTVDEFRMGVAETYDVIVEPDADSAYAIFAQNIDRSGYALARLTPDEALRADVPSMDPPVLLGHADMGMDHGGHDMSAMSHTTVEPGRMQGMDHSGHNMAATAVPARKTLQGKAGFGSAAEIHHETTEFGPQVDMRTMSPANGLLDPGVGLRDHLKLFGRRVLNYGDLKNLEQTRDRREPEREIALHLTGNMSRYMWSINGIRFADAEPLALKLGERLRITLVNDTMMTHPVHLHGMWSELETGDPARMPRKHTVIVQPGSKISY
ncbi:MAG: copper resistance system multicopper oxidase, partial [Gammaproteobacteria bacterium]|nr:copper resistance system multicopper oxidase [Gammaproteobacteria bacterium]